MKFYSPIELVQMEQDAIFEEKVSLSAKDMSGEILSFDDILLRKMRKQIEGKCTKHGFLLPGSLKLLSRSYGYMEKGTFTADSLYYMKAQGRVYNPPNGTVVEGVVMRKSKAGLYIIIENAVHVMVVRDLHIGNREFDAVELGDTIRVEIKKSRFQINDPHILSIGQFLTVVSVGTAPAPAPAEAPEAEAEEATPSDGLDATPSDGLDATPSDGLDATPSDGLEAEVDPFKAPETGEEISL
jgi:DNA-directed RNA polymerase subunit E'/Rpb7